MTGLSYNGVLKTCYHYAVC